jgi:hypothetical protein
MIMERWTESISGCGKVALISRFARIIHGIRLFLGIIIRRRLAIRSFPSEFTNMKTKFAILTMMLTVPFAAPSQGTFENLDFENANATGFTPPTTIPAVDAFPGWDVLIGTTPTSVVAYDALSIGGPAVAIIDGTTGFVPIQGNYTAYLMASSIQGHAATVSLRQTGTVPAGNEWIELDANQVYSSSFSVTLNGTAVSMTPLHTYPSYTLYGGNVSAWAGQTATLAITENEPSNPQLSPSLLQLDNIFFSPVEVTPEPSPLVLTGIGGILFAACRRFWAKRE